MVLNNYRHLLPRFINKPVNFCIKHKITPNQISVMGFILSTIAAITYAFPNIFLYNYSVITPNIWWFWACVPPWLFFFSAYVDVLDGSVARKTGQASKFGAFLDSTLDRISDAVVLLGLMFSGIVWPWNNDLNNVLCFICLSTMLMISYTRSRAELEGVVMKGIGFMERAERVFILLGGYILEWGAFAIQEFFFGYAKYTIFPVFFIIFTLLCLQTLFARVSWASKWLNNKMPEKVEEILEKQKLQLEKQKMQAEAEASSEKCESDSKKE
jgi:phosphatidylglycerophosphate synthase